jgi:hypothetical protein
VGPLKVLPRLRQFQIVQRTVERYAVRYVAEAALSADEETAIRAEFGRILGYAANVDFERVAEVPRAPSGKFMTALSEVSAARG